MKLTVWIAEQNSDSTCYNIVGKTKKEVLHRVANHGGAFEAPVKVVIEYKDAFDLFERLTDEGGGRHIYL